MAKLLLSLTFLFFTVVNLGASERVPGSYWETSKFFLLTYTHLYRQDSAAGRKVWQESLRKAKECHVDGIIAVVPKEFFAEGCPSVDIAQVCKAYLEECAAVGLKCVLCMGALENAKDGEKQEVWAQKDANSRVLNSIASTCVQSQALAGYVLHIEPEFKDEDLYVESCQSLIANLRKVDPDATVFVKGNSADVDKISVVQRIGGANVLPSAHIFAYHKGFHKPHIAQECDNVKDNFCFMVVGHNQKRLCDAPQDRAQFYSDAIRYGAQRGWSVALWGYDGKGVTALDDACLESIKSTISDVRNASSEKCAA